LNNQKGKLIVISAPSGAGKSSLIKSIIDSNENIELSISATTREPRHGEENGKDYFFVSDEEFDSLKLKNEFVEHATVHYHHQYGTLRSYINERIEKGINIILDIDVQGFMQIKDAGIDNTSIFIIPPSIKELQNRLNTRGLDSNDVIQRRLENAKNELTYAKDFDYRVLNDAFEDALNNLLSIIYNNDYAESENEKSAKILQNLLS